MFHNPIHVPELVDLHQHLRPMWLYLRKIAIERMGEFKPWHEPINLGGWHTLSLKWQGEPQPGCPRAFLRDDVINAGFSLMEPGAQIAPHEGYTGDVIRYHLGLICPGHDQGECIISVGGHRRSWVEGEAFAFDDTQTHWARNRTPSGRLILIVDVKRIK